jgi:hypothetical protein
MGCSETDAAFVAGRALARRPAARVDSDRCQAAMGGAAQIFEMLLLLAIDSRLKERGSRLKIVFK